MQVKKDVPPQYCLTASGALIHDEKVLLVKHKKLGIWLCPGGHVEGTELPHQAAEREFWEETGVEVQAINLGLSGKNKHSEYFPSPVISNLHWISTQNYEVRTEQKLGQLEKGWERGCEQHFDLKFLMEPVAGVEFKQNVEETDGIGWFTEEEIIGLETTDGIKSEIIFCMDIMKDAYADLDPEFAE